MDRLTRWLCRLLPAALLLACGDGVIRGQADDLSPEARRLLERARRSVDVVYRPTVILARGDARGSGTIIASYPGETLILTAAHVVAPEGDLEIEFYPYNLGVEPGGPEARDGSWPRRWPGEVVARDEPADVALVRVRGGPVAPYVARLAAVAEEPEPDDVLMSVGVDAGAPLTGWRTTVRGLPILDIGQGEFRPFLTTTRPPLPGRSGGGLFLPDGAVVGVCVGRMSVEGAPHDYGVFASIRSIRELLDAHRLGPLIARSESWHRRQREAAAPHR